jgi:hypothetical protein
MIIVDCNSYSQGIEISKKCTQLEWLNLSKCNISETCSSVSVLTNLTHLEIASVYKLNDKAVTSWSQLTRLSSLNISNETITSLFSGKGLEILSAFLMKLNVSRCNIGEEHLLSAVKLFKFVKVLALAAVKGVNDNVVAMIASSCSSLEDLNLEQTAITENGILRLALSLLPLTRLNVNHCKIGDSILSLVQTKPLQKLFIASTGISSGALLLLPRYLTQVTELDLEETYITDYHVLLFSWNCSKLSWLSLAFCLGLSEDCLVSIVEYLPRLLTLDLRANSFPITTPKIIQEHLSLLYVDLIESEHIAATCMQRRDGKLKLFMEDKLSITSKSVRNSIDRHHRRNSLKTLMSSANNLN